MAKILATHIKPYLQHIIDSQQTGCMEGQFIGINIRKLIDIMHYVEREQMEALILAVDFEKCFDSIEFDALQGAMRFFNIGEQYIKNAMLLHSGFESCVVNNGYVTDWFEPTRAIHQGCPLRGILYLLCVEILALKLKNNENIEGINIMGETEIVSQYADDINVFSQFKASSLQAIIDTFLEFEANTGLKVIYEKSVIYRIGSAKNKCEKLITTKSFKWANGDISMLGVMVTCEDEMENNFLEVLEKAQAITKLWSQRDLSLITESKQSFLSV